MTDVKKLLAEATPLPWKECGAARGGCVCGFVWDSNGNFPLLTTDTDSEHEGFRSTGKRKVTDAALIVHAVNSLPDYEAAVDAMLEYLAHDGSGIRRDDEWAGDYDALKLATARDRLRAALQRLRGAS